VDGFAEGGASRGSGESVEGGVGEGGKKEGVPANLLLM